MRTSLTHFIHKILLCIFFIFQINIHLNANDEKMDEGSKKGQLTFSESNISYPEMDIDVSFIIEDQVALLSKANNKLLLWNTEAQTWITHDLSQNYPQGDLITHNDVIYLAGKRNSNGLSEHLMSISLKDESIEEKLFIELPEKLFMPSISILNNSIYLFGGLKDQKAKVVSNKLWSLDLNGETQEWASLADFPEDASMASIVNTNFGQIAVLGGMKYDSSDKWMPHSDVWVYLPKPVDGTTFKGWKKYENMPKAIAGGKSIATGQSHLMTVSGWSGALSQEDLITQNFTHTNKDIIISHLITFKHIYQKDPNPSGSLTILNADSNKLLFSNSSSPILSWDTKESIKGLSTLDYVIIILHFVVMAWMGVYFSKKQDNSEEFALGGRKVNWFAGALSMFATGASSISFMAIPAVVFSSNMTWFAGAIMLIPTFFIQTYLVYPLIRSLNVTSTYEYLHMRFHISIRYLASAQLILAHSVGRISVVMLLPSLAISATTGLDLYLSIILMGIITTVYTTIGGFEAVVWSDMIQGLLMIGASFLIIFLAINSLDGGMSQFIEVNQSFDKFTYAIWDWDFALPAIWFFFIFTLLAELAAGGEQPSVQRVLATPKKDIVKLSFSTISFTILASFATMISGLSIFCFFHEKPEKLNPLMQNDQVVPLYVVENIPSGFTGLIIAALFAASMSTLSSSINSISIVACKDFYERWRPGLSDKQKLIFMKVACLIVGINGTCVALYMASMDLKSLWATMSQLLAFLGGGFASIYILGMFTKRANTGGVICGVIISSITLSLAKISSIDFHWTLYPIIAMTSALIGGYLCSFFFKGNGNELNHLTIHKMLNQNK